MTRAAEQLKQLERAELEKIISNIDSKKTLKNVLSYIQSKLEEASESNQAL